MTPADIIATARLAIGIPFRHEGRNPETGLDCAGLICFVAAALGVAYEDRASYPRRPSGGMLESALDGQACLVRVKGAPQPGDILLMRFQGEPQHLAIFTGTNIIHAHQPNKRVVEHGFIGPWPRRLVRVYRFAEVTE